MTALHHVTLNTGHLAVTPRADAERGAIDRLLPVLDAQGGPVPGMAGWFLDVFSPLDARGAALPGAAFFQVAKEPGSSKRPAVMAVACWSSGMGSGAWGQAVSSYSALREPLIRCNLWCKPPADPPRQPWLAAWLTPWAALASPRDIFAMGGLERCVAWALVER